MTCGIQTSILPDADALIAELSGLTEKQNKKMRNIDIQELSIGTKVYWHDPAGETSGIYEILIMPDINELTKEELEYDDLILLIGDGFSEAEVFIRELDIFY